MSEILRKYWFVCLIAVLFIGVLIFFIVDLNKDNVSKKSADGQDVVATTTLGNITSSDLFDELSPNASSVLYSLYRNQVVDQAVEADSAMKAEAKQMAKNIENNMKSDSTGKTRESIMQTLASYGFTGDNAPYDYALTALKFRKIDTDYIRDHYDDLKIFAPEQGRTISIITMQVSNDQVLTEKAQTKQDDIQKALDEGKSFADVAKEFSEDEDTASNGGFYGYIDSSTTDLDSNVLSAALALENGGTSDWISVQPDGMSLYTLYKVHVEETDPEKLLNSDNEDVVEGFVLSMAGSVSGLESAAVEEAAKKLDIKFENEDVEKQIKDLETQQSEALESSKKTKQDEIASEEAAASEASSETSKADDSQASSAAEGE